MTSGGLAEGTPVDVRSVFDLAYSAGAGVSLGSIDGANFARSMADVQVVANGVVGIDQNANRLLDDLESGSFLQTGLFSGDQHAAFTISTTVGSPFQLAVVVDADAVGAVRPSAGAPGLNGAAHAESFLALSLGAEVVDIEATIASALVGGPFPLAAFASPAAAQGALPANPLAVPEPRGLLELGLLGLVAVAACRPRSPRG